MKNRMNIVMVTLLVILGMLVWGVIKTQRGGFKPLAAVAPTVAPSSDSLPRPTVQALPQPDLQPDSLVRRHAIDEPARIGDDDTARHIAQPGETVTSLAADLLGKDNKSNRDVIINANPSLKADPDKLVAGKSYRIPAAPDVLNSQAPQTASGPAASAEAAAPTPALQNAKPASDSNDTIPSKPTTELKYTAAPGDTVAKMAGAFLGSDTKTHQDAIINANPSLQADPDRVLVGKAYRIPAPDGLSASPASAQAPRPTTQPDADQVVRNSSPRNLRYTARPGDTVTTIAIELLGSDTQETRDAIIDNNPSLKRDPDRVIAGQTYWIPAPVAAIPNP